MHIPGDYVHFNIHLKTRIFKEDSLVIQHTLYYILLRQDYKPIIHSQLKFTMNIKI
jgi:stress-induced morphogen